MHRYTYLRQLMVSADCQYSTISRLKPNKYSPCITRRLPLHNRAPREDVGREGEHAERARRRDRAHAHRGGVRGPRQQHQRGAPPRRRDTARCAAGPGTCTGRASTERITGMTKAICRARS